VPQASSPDSLLAALGHDGWQCDDIGKSHQQSEDIGPASVTTYRSPLTHKPSASIFSNFLEVIFVLCVVVSAGQKGAQGQLSVPVAKETMLVHGW
jgi:hypothetical protein